MMTELKSECTDFNNLLESLYGQVATIDSLADLRAKAWQRFQTLGLPQRKHELFRYINMRRLYESSYASAEPVDLVSSAIDVHVLPECKESVLVFVNGYFQPSLSRTGSLPEKMILMGLAEAMRKYGALLTNQWVKSVKEEEDPFAALNGACHNEGVFIYLPPKIACQAPLQMLYLTVSGDQSAIVMPRLHVFAGAHSSLKLVATHASSKEQGYCINQLTEMTLEENAHVHLTQINTQSSPNIWHFDALRANLKRDSSLITVSHTNGSMSIRNDYKVVLAGENCHASLNGGWVLSEKREAHCHVFMDHRAPNCTSNQLYKGVLYDSSHSSFDGKIVVRQEAQKTNAFQRNNNIILGNGAIADSSPNLKIYADDVKASHGATVGQLSEEELFYMRTRGLNETSAKQILVAGFCREVIDMLPLVSLRGLYER